ncbi:hypothetical protein BOH74_03250 [Pseudomonas versuta]|uniref:Uncharacterized protein n=1 Tax=Pseudomonas versuta TaxID=1788301 RepID=A0A0M4Q7A0_9PSED|nr:hypothetical protein [Pseudomonas versuta]ALE86980.1 hypothetical protein AOC04_01515 [Pseudomonas versuta]OKA24680.1 hypothetical protein BOH73_01975 [Pseudomonas versuta]OKA28479.1 hypothetical protein BOH74_03250 [Pseudomonas versuta]
MRAIIRAECDRCTCLVKLAPLKKEQRHLYMLYLKMQHGGAQLLLAACLLPSMALGLWTVANCPACPLSGW